MGLYLRELNDADYKVVDFFMQNLHNLHVEKRPDLYKPSEHIYSQEEFQRIIENPDRIAIAAVMDGEVAGICIAAVRGPKEHPVMIVGKTVYIEDFYVDSGFRKQGVGKAMFEYVSREAREAGAERIDLMVWAFNQGAAAFYEELGMSPQRYIMEKKL